MGKCTYMHFMPNISNKEQHSQEPNNSFSLSINNVKIKKVNCTRFLGVIIDDKLTWDAHLEYLENKLKSCLVQIKRIKTSIPKSEYHNIYQSLFVSHLTYCISAWGGGGKNKLEKLFRIQKRCIRLLFGNELTFDNSEFYDTCARARSFKEHTEPKDFSLEHTKPIFNDNKLLTIHNLYNKHTFNETYKIMKMHSPISMFSEFEFVSNHKFNSHKIRVSANKKLVTSRHNFIYKATLLRDSLIDRVLFKDNPSNSGLIIPGSSNNTDLSASVLFAKNRIKSLLLVIQSSGDKINWEDSNFDPGLNKSHIPEKSK